VNGGIVDDEDRVGKGPFIHAWEKACNELPEDVASDGILDNLEVQNAIEG